MQRAEIVQALQRRYGLVGRTQFVLDEVVVPVVLVDEVETRTGPLLAIARRDRAPGAGNNARVQLDNATGSGNLMHVRKVTISTDANSAVDAMVGPNAFVGVGTERGFWQDLRRDGQPVGRTDAGDGGAVAGQDTILRVRLLANDPFVWEPRELLLPEGNLLQLVAQSTDVTFSAVFEWAEIPPGQQI